MAGDRSRRTRCSSDSAGSDDDIAGARSGQVPGLTVVDPDLENWFVANATFVGNPGPSATSVRVVGYTADCDDEGAVDYAVSESASSVRVTLVLGESGEVCQDEGLAHEVDVPLTEPLGERQVAIE